VFVFGGLTLWLSNDIFIKIKPTILYAMFALVLLAVWFSAALYQIAARPNAAASRRRVADIDMALVGIFSCACATE
jgi:hypothetical protein